MQRSCLGIHKGVTCGILLSVVPGVQAVTWQYEETSGFTLEALKVGTFGKGDESVWNALTDKQYLTICSMVVDPVGNVHFTAGVARKLRSLEPGHVDALRGVKPITR